MSNLKLSIFIAILLVAVPTAFSYDYLKLALQWPPTVSDQQQFYPSPMNYTIHGVWPENFLGPWPLPPCPLQNPYVSITDLNLLSRLQVSWPNLLGSNDWFWGHEWNKHGGCSEAVYNQTQYFALGLELKDRYDVQKMLGFSFIFPGVSVLLSDLDSEIRYRFHKKAEFGCNKGPVFELSEIRMCFDPSLALIDCPPRSGPLVCSAQHVYMHSTALAPGCPAGYVPTPNNCLINAADKRREMITPEV